MNEPMPIETISPSELHATAKDIAWRSEHWSRLSIVLGRIQDEHLYPSLGPGYGSARAYAESELDVDFDLYTGLLALWKFMVAHHHLVPLATWHEIPKTHAQLIRRVVNLGGDVLDWITKAKECGTTDALRQEIEHYLDKEVWTTFKAAVPVAMVPVIEEALQLALPEALEEDDPVMTGRRLDPDPELVKTRGVRFRALLVIIKFFAENYRAPGSGAYGPPE